jgi:hypothetical protein
MGKGELQVLAIELVAEVRKSVTIDWTLRESGRAKNQSPGEANPAKTRATHQT